MSKRTPHTVSLERLPQIARREDRAARSAMRAPAHRSLARRLHDLIDDRPGTDHNTSLSELTLRPHGTFPATRY